MSLKISGKATGAILTNRSTTAKATLGARVFDSSGNEYVYVKAGAAIALNDACRFAGSTLGFDDIRPTSAAQQTVFGVATTAFASGEYGFLLVRGVATCKVIVATAAGSALVSGATAGTLALSVVGTDFANRPAVALVTGVAAGSAIALW